MSMLKLVLQPEQQTPSDSSESLSAPATPTAVSTAAVETGLRLPEHKPPLSPTTPNAASFEMQALLDSFKGEVLRGVESSNASLLQSVCQALTAEREAARMVHNQSTEAALQRAAQVEKAARGDAAEALRAEASRWSDRQRGLVDVLSRRVSEDLQRRPVTLTGEQLTRPLAEALEAHLTPAFRAAFEDCLLPAFQAGVDRLFYQMNRAFEGGLAGLQEQAAAAGAQAAQSNQELRNQVSELQKSVQQLTERLEAVSGRLGSSAEASPDPLRLLAEGRLVDAVEAALERKDVSQLSQLLVAIGDPSALTACPTLLKLCALQQLAADAATGGAAEGMATRLDWMKSLVMGVLFPANGAKADSGSGDDVEQYIQTVFRSVHSSLEAVEQQHKAGTGTAEMLLTNAAFTDLRMLLTIVSTRL